MAEYCPVLRPTHQEFIHPREYIKSIEHIVIKHGICKIIPPPSWNPRHAIQCLCGPGNFMTECTQQTQDNKTNKNGNGFEYDKPGLMKYDTNKFGTHMSADNYAKACNAQTMECLCGFNNAFADQENDSLFSIHTAHTASCPYIQSQYAHTHKTDSKNSQKQSNESTKEAQTTHALRNQINLEKHHRHRHDICLNTIKVLSMQDLHSYIHCYLAYDHLWYEGQITEINIDLNCCDIRLTKDDSIITLYPMETILIKVKKEKAQSPKVEKIKCETETNSNTSTDSMDDTFEHCPSMIAHELPQRLREISNICHWKEMGRVPSNIINSYVSMNMTIYEDDYYFETGKSIDEYIQNNASATHSLSDLTLVNKDISHTNDTCEYLSEIIIKEPIRQSMYQSPNAKGGVYHCVNVVEHERMSVKYFFEKTQTELKAEISESKKTKEIMEWIENDEIETHFDEILREWLRNLTYRHPLYGADSIGSLFHPNAVWNLGSMDSILELISDIQGVTIPYLYFGSWRSMFAWHIEDRALWALNYLHFGRPKIWFGVPVKDCAKMEQVMAANFPKDYAFCNVFTRHKNSFIAPKLLLKNGINVCKAVQRANEIIVTGPSAYHSGFNLGFNCAEAVNFATVSWIPIGIKAPHCKCGIMQSSVKLDIESMIHKIQTQYPQLASEMPKLPNNYQKILKQQNKTKRNLDCYYVPPKKRRKLNESSGRGKGRGRGRSGRGLRNGVKTRKSSADSVILKKQSMKCEKRKGYGRSRASTRRLSAPK